MSISSERKENYPFINEVDEKYLSLLNDILLNGTSSPDRTGTGTTKIFGRMLGFDLSKKFPILTTKLVRFDLIKKELLWFMRGERNLRSLVLEGVNIWNEWPYQRYLIANKLTEKHTMYSQSWKDHMKEFVQKIKDSEDFASQWGDLGPVYGYQWRHWKTQDGQEIDQLANVVSALKDPEKRYSRRLIVTAWNPSDVDQMALPPCHMQYQFQVETDGTLNCLMYQRSVDTFLGLPFNISSYALLTNIIAKISGLIPGRLILALGDTHIYNNHIEQVKEQLSRDPRPLPNLVLDDSIVDLNNISPNSIWLVGYDPHPAIKAEISV